MKILNIDGSMGEGGGQVLRTCLSLSALTGRSFYLFNIRSGRSTPGLRPQHLTAVKAAAAVCSADLKGASLNSTDLEFRPGSSPRGGRYRFDVSESAQGGSAGATTLILQTLLWPLSFADTTTHLTLLGGTHVPFSPSFHYLNHVALPLFASLGSDFEMELEAWGWYPMGGGILTASVKPIRELRGSAIVHSSSRAVHGLAAVTNLPSHIPQRMAQRAHNLLQDADLTPDIRPLRASGRGPGAGITIWRYGAGATSLGRKGMPAEKVAEAAVTELLEFLRQPAAVDKHLADQLLLPMALAHGQSSFFTNSLTAHTFTNAQLLRQWLEVDIEIIGELDKSGSVSIHGIGFAGS